MNRPQVVYFSSGARTAGWPGSVQHSQHPYFPGIWISRRPVLKDAALGRHAQPPRARLVCNRLLHQPQLVNDLLGVSDRAVVLKKALDPALRCKVWTCSLKRGIRWLDSRSADSLKLLESACLRFGTTSGARFLKSRTEPGYRKYSPDTVRLIRFIKRAQDLGFTLTEIEELIALRDGNGRRRTEVRQLAEARMRDIDEKVTQLQAMRRPLSTLVASCACGGGRPTCPILEAFDDPINAAKQDSITSSRRTDVQR